MPYSVSETKQILRAALLGAGAVQALGRDGVQVFTQHDRSSAEAARSLPVLVVDFRGGRPRRVGAPIQSRTVHLYAYSAESQHHADVLHEEATAALTPDDAEICHPLRNTDPSAPQQRVTVRETSGAAGGWNEKVGAWFARSSLRVWQVG